MKKEKENLDEVEACEVNDKKNMILKVLVGVLAFIVVVASCFGAGYFGSKFGNKDKEEEKNEEKDENKEVPNLTIDSDEVKKLYEVFREDKDCSTASYWKDHSTDETKKFIAYYAALKESSKDIRCGDLDHSYVDGYHCAFTDDAAKYYGNEDVVGFENAIKNEKTVGVTEEVLEAKYKELFGKDAVLLKGNLPLGGGPLLYYDKVNKLYAKFGCQCGDECAGVTQTLDSISQDGKKLVLNTTIVENIDRVTKYYVSYTFEFEETTGNYIFVSRDKKDDENNIAFDVLDDLKNKIDVSNVLTLDNVLGSELYQGNKSFTIYTENSDSYDYMIYLTYNYYLASTGKTAEKWSSKDSSYGPCYVDGQNGYCYVIDKTEMEKYDKMLFNLNKEYSSS